MCLIGDKEEFCRFPVAGLCYDLTGGYFSYLYLCEEKSVEVSQRIYIYILIPLRKFEKEEDTEECQLFFSSRPHTFLSNKRAAKTRNEMVSEKVPVRSQSILEPLSLLNFISRRWQQTHPIRSNSRRAHQESQQSHTVEDSTPGMFWA